MILVLLDWRSITGGSEKKKEWNYLLCSLFTECLCVKVATNSRVATNGVPTLFEENVTNCLEKTFTKKMVIIISPSYMVTHNVSTGHLWWSQSVVIVHEWLWLYRRGNKTGYQRWLYVVAHHIVVAFLFLHLGIMQKCLLNCSVQLYALQHIGIPNTTLIQITNYL